MVKILSLFCVVAVSYLLLLCPTSSGVSHNNFPVNAPRIRIKSEFQSFVTVHSGGQCSGSVVQLKPNTKPFVLTANHCITGEKSALVEFYDGSERVFKVKSTGNGMANKGDWALLEGDTQNIAPLLIADKEPQHFPLITFYVGRDQWIIPAVVVLEDSEDFVLIARVQPGDSGSALLSEDGKVLGIVHSFSPGTGLGYAASAWGINYPSKEQKESPSMNPQSEASVPQDR